MADTTSSTGTERAAARAENTAERETSKRSGGVSDSESGHSREGNVNSGGQGVKGKLGDALGNLSEVVKGSGLVVGAGAYNEGAVTPNPYYQYGTVDTGGFGGPPNIRAVSHVFDKARHDALVFAGAVVDDTTGNAAGIGKGVGEGYAPELVTMTPLTGQAARDAEKARVEAAATYQTGHPVMLHGLHDGVLAAAQEADEYGNPIDDDAPSGRSQDADRTGSRQVGPAGSDSNAGDYSDRSDRDSEGTSGQERRATATGSSTTSSSRTSGSQPTQPDQSGGQSSPSGAQRTEEPGRRPVDPTRGSGSQA